MQGNKRETMKKDHNISILVLLCFIALNIFLIFRHEPWGDEAQPWLVARDLDPIGIARMMKYDGHSCLWHFILLPFAKLGFPYKTMDYVSLLLVIPAVWLFMTRAPFPKAAKIMLIFSPVFVYYFPVISRCYAMIPAIIMLLAVHYPKRKEKPLIYGLLIALLVHTHVIMLGMAAILSFIWLFESINDFRRDRDKKALSKAAIGLLFPLIAVILLALLLFQVSYSSAFGIGIANGDGLFEAGWACVKNSIISLLGSDLSLLAGCDHCIVDIAT